MATTHFQTFIDAFAAVDKRSRVLAGDDVLCPPSEDFHYQSTPSNAVTFASMGVDGVHWVILKLQGRVRDDSPVAYVSPMDSNDIAITAATSLRFLADGCDVSADEMQAVFDAERSGGRQLLGFLSGRFDPYRLLNAERTLSLTAQYGHLIERRVQ